MTSNLPATFANLTTGARNIYDVVSQLISLRRQNKLISAGQLERLNIAIKATIQADKMASVHTLEANARAFLIDSYEDIKRHLNTPFGDLLLESVQHEARLYREYIDNYSFLTRHGGFR